MSTGSMRRAQLINPFGVGAMSILVDGTSVITAGLDHWFDAEIPSDLLLEEFEAHDWRLQSRLRVSGLRLPPDWRQRHEGGDPRNTGLKVPVLRFPRWHFCMYCKRLEESTLTMQQAVRCSGSKCADRAYQPRMAQVPFVIICRNGHIGDFPFREWVHHDLHPTCSGVLSLTSEGGGGLEGQVVTCGPRKGKEDDDRPGCGARRSLMGITDASPANGEERTSLSSSLSKLNEEYLCTGYRPWLQESNGECGLPVRGALRAAGNVYFPKVESSIYLPQHEGAVSAQMHELMQSPSVAPVLRAIRAMHGPEATQQQIRSVLEQSVPAELIAPISDEALLAGYRDLVGPGDHDVDDNDETDALTADDEWRHPEFERLRDTPVDDYLTATDPKLHPELTTLFDRVRSVDVMRETRALRGFTRVYDSDLPLSEGKALLRRATRPRTEDWLPAYVVKGEGIYLELNAKYLQEWENRPDVQKRARLIHDHFAEAAVRRGQRDRIIEPRLVLLHTLAHLLINQLVFDCGYSSAALRERLYSSTRPARDMAGFLLYTAAGDSEGTMGGLVRMARPDTLRSVIRSAIESARWCSTDPVCMDSGTKGQGPDSCNLAACHGCALLPETSCEEFNRFLDRGLVIGTLEDRSLGFFSDLA